jgi:hypothetical protein
METCRTFAREHHEMGYWGGENDEARLAAGYRAVSIDPGVKRRAQVLEAGESTARSIAVQRAFARSSPG